MLFTFPSRYLFAIGLSVVFSLTGWSPLIPTGFLVSRGTQVPTRFFLNFTYAAFTLFGSAFQRILLSVLNLLRRSYNPE